MNRFIVRIGCQLIFLVLVIEVGNVVVADTHSFVIRAAKENTCLSQIDQCNNVGLLLDEIILCELVIRDQLAELVLQVTDFLTLARLTFKRG